MPVLCVLTKADPPEACVRWALRFAYARRTTLEVLWIERQLRPQTLLEASLGRAGDEDDTGAPPDPAVEGRHRDLLDRLRAALNELFPVLEAGRDEPEDAPWRRDIPFAAVAHPQPARALAEHLRARESDLVVLGAHTSGDAEAFRRRALRSLHQDVVLLRTPKEGGRELGRILCPAAGGPHARRALKLCELLALYAEAELTALYVEPPHAAAAEEAEAVGLRKVQRALEVAGVKVAHRVHPRVVLSGDVQAAIQSTWTEERSDLVAVGASNRGALERALRRALPETLLHTEGAPAVVVFRRATPIARRLQDALAHAARRRVPQLEREDRIALFDRLETGSRLDFDYLALMALSTAIASLGLMQNAAAVVIGAMLVAPLMTPLLGAGLALVQGNAPLAREASRATAFGLLCALGIAGVLGLATGGQGLTPELLSRGAPNLIDLAVAACAGLAAAYATARPNLSAALPGVAIAAALVPPIATASIACVRGHAGVALGAALLFVTNLVVIVLAAATCFYAVGVRSRRNRTRAQRWGRRALLALNTLALALAFTLGTRTQPAGGGVGKGRPDADGAERGAPPPALVASLGAAAGRLGRRLRIRRVRVAPGERAGSPTRVSLQLEAPAAPDPSLTRQLAAAAAVALGAPVELEVDLRLTARGAAPADNR